MTTNWWKNTNFHGSSYTKRLSTSIRLSGNASKTSHFLGFFVYLFCLEKSELRTFTSWPRSSRSWKHQGHTKTPLKTSCYEDMRPQELGKFPLNSSGFDIDHLKQTPSKKIGETRNPQSLEMWNHGLSHIGLKICSSHMEPWETVGVDLGVEEGRCMANLRLESTLTW